MVKEFFTELFDEAGDFFEDFWEHILRKEPSRPIQKRKVVINGVVTIVRPAYVFAERIDNLLKVLFGTSIALSALTASFLGYTKLSDLLEVLITSLLGRIVMLIIGISYLMVAFWKLMHLSHTKTTT